MQINRVWAMPNSKTFQIKPIRELINKYAYGVIVDPFANDSKIGTITNDLDEQYDTDYHMDALDFLKMLGDNSIDTVLYDPPYCYDETTEVFTKDGFKSFKDVTYQDEIATLNTQNNHLEYHNPIEIISKKYCGDMINIDSQSISMFVTPNHKCWVKDSFYNNYHWLDAKDLYKNTSKHWFQKTCDWDGDEQEYFILPAVNFIKANRYGEKNKPDKYIKMDIWLKFLGLYLSEGDCYIRGKSDYSIRISQRKKIGRKYIKDVLNEIGYNYIEEKDRFTIYDKQLYMYLNTLGKSDKKYIPEEFKNLSKRQLLILIEALMIGDGTNITYHKFNKSTNKTYFYTTNSYYTNSIKLRDDFVEIAIKSGRGVSIKVSKKKDYKDVYAIHILKSSNFSVKQKDYSVMKNWEGTIYCLTVPNSTLLVKRKGRVYWCGNSPRQVSECYSSLGKTVNMQTTQASYWSKQKEQIGRIVKKDGIVITCCWNSGGIGKKYGFEIEEILLVPHGGWHNDTIVTVERKVV